MVVLKLRPGLRGPTPKRLLYSIYSDVFAIFIFTRYGVRILDTVAECINIQFLSLINDKNIKMGLKSHKFEEECEGKLTELQPNIGFHFEPDLETEEDEIEEIRKKENKK